MPLSRVAVAAVFVFLIAAPAAAQPAARGLRHLRRRRLRTIDVRSYAFNPKPIVLSAGRPVTLTFTNQSGSSHDFTAKEFFAASTITAGSASEGEIELKPYETKRITLIPRTGTYHAHCSHFMHAFLGMTDQIIVN